MFEWWKGNALILKFSKPGQTVIYYNDFCGNQEVCSPSHRGYFNTSTGELTLYNVSLEDEGLYYYRFQLAGDVSPTVIKFQVHVKVLGKFPLLIMYGLIGLNFTSSCRLLVAARVGVERTFMISCA